MAETTDELGLVEGVGGHFHATHGLHVLVYFEQLTCLGLNFEGRAVAFEGAERVLMKSGRKRLGVVRNGTLQEGGVRRRDNKDQTKIFVCLVKAAIAQLSTQRRNRCRTTFLNFGSL